MESDLQIFLAYLIGTLVGIILSKKFWQHSSDDLIEMLIEQGFLRHKKDTDGNVVILKYHDNREQ